MLELGKGMVWDTIEPNPVKDHFIRVSTSSILWCQYVNSSTIQIDSEFRVLEGADLNKRAVRHHTENEDLQT